MIRKHFLVLLVGLLPALIPSSAAAILQEASPAVRSAPAAATPPKNLGEALPYLRWDPAERGPLLIVAPQATTPIKPATNTAADTLNVSAAPLPAAPLPAAPLPAAPPSLINGVYRQSDLLQYFGCRLVRLRGVTVFAPAEMLLLNTDLGKPDLYSRMRMRDKLQMLEATLTPAQWQKISSPAGLGIGDTEGEQRALFEAMLPNPFIYQIRMRNTPVDVSGEPEPPARKATSAAQRSGIRLRIYRETHFGAPSVDPSSPFSAAYVEKKEPNPFRVSVYEAPKFTENSAYGATLSQTLPSRLKAGQIDFDSAALNALIALTDAATVGDLIERIRQETRVEIYADRRLARLPVWMRAVPDARLRAGDALKVLCWGVSGAVRRVSDPENTNQAVFLLTEDLKGLGSRLGRISEWTESAFNAEMAAKRRLDRVIRAKNALQHIGFAPEEIFTPTAQQASEIEKAWTNSTSRYLGTTFPIDALPPDLQERVRTSARAANTVRAQSAEENREPLVSGDSVLIAVRLGLRLEVPDVGSIPLALGSFGGLDSFLPPADYSAPETEALPKQITLSPDLKAGGILCVTPSDEEEARTAVQAARLRGLRQVWIGALPDTENASAKKGDTEFPRILAAAIQEAREPGENPIAVLAVTCVLSVPQRKTEAKEEIAEPLPPLDVTIDGKTETIAIKSRVDMARQAGEEMPVWDEIAKNTRDWLLPDAPGVTARIVKRLRRLAETPGLGGIVLTDLLAPGYRVPKGADANDANTSPSLGYTASRRITAIRTIGYDPIDIDIDRDRYFPSVSQPAFFGDSFQQSLLKDIFKTPEQMKALDAALEKEDIQAIGEFSPVAAWNTLRFRAAGELMRKIHTALSAAAKTHTDPFPVYLQSIVNSDGGVWFGSWDQSEKLPIIQSIQQGEDYLVRLERSARAVSKSVLYSHSFQPSELVPLPPAEKFVLDFNRSLSKGRPSWDGYVFDMRELPLGKALNLLQGVTPIGTPVIMSPSRALDASRSRRR